MKIIAVDFDGTLCQDKWPDIGKPNREIIHALIQRQAAGDKVILWTCRCGVALDAAIAWSMDHGLRFDAINENTPENIAEFGNDCRKVFAHEYWDDRSVMVRGHGTPLMAWFKENGNICLRRWVRTTLEVKAETVVERIKRRWRSWRRSA